MVPAQYCVGGRREEKKVRRITLVSQFYAIKFCIKVTDIILCRYVLNIKITVKYYMH